MTDIRTTPVLDDFERLVYPEYPLSHGGDWGGTDAARAYQLQLINQGGEGRATHPNNAAAGSPPNARPQTGESTWVHPFDTPASGWLEVWGRPTGGNASGIAWSLGHWQQPFGSNQVDGYRARQEVSSGGGATRIYRWFNGVATTLATGPNAFTGAVLGSRMLFRRNASGLMQLWYSSDSGANWTLKVSATDNTFTGQFYVGCGITDNSVSQILAWGEVGGGVPNVTIPLIGRRVRVSRLGPPV